MKESLLSIWKLSCLIMITGFSPQFSQSQVPDEKIKTDLFQLEQALNVGVQMHDTTALKQILAMEYQLSGPRFPGGIRRREWLSNVHTYFVDSVAISDVSVSNWGEIAVFRSLQHFYNLIIRGEPGSYTESRITDLWIKRDGRWQLITRLSERLPKK
ncbi:MAG TPA: nuclear transport factor 2 family protein [Chitinophagaceae bacterium]|nr:nuclear transport factor 2 family protein [Chitinophagaceae bacterium]